MVPRRVYDVVKKSDEFTSAGFPAQRVKVRNRSQKFGQVRNRSYEVNSGL